MKIYNQDKSQVLNNPDLNKGYLVYDKIVSKILPAKEEIAEQGHYEVIKEYKNGGKDLKWIVDVEGQKASPETPIYEDIQVYIPFTELELNQQEYYSLKNWFDTIYTYKEQKYRRLLALNKNDDDGISGQTKLNSLYLEAEEKRARIQELEK